MFSSQVAAFAQVTHTPVAPTQGTHACEALVEASSIDFHALAATFDEVGWSEGVPRTAYFVLARDRWEWGC